MNNNNKKIKHSGTKYTPSSKARRLSTQWGVSQGAIQLILTHLHRRLAPPFIQIFGAPFPNFCIIHLNKKNVN